ncbi:hypothetical protein QN216_06520 [Bifidobacterium fermentum]|uniref:Uncharacterized protein n=1 Tax=Bifidobacterium fermentum TaxID=3059035 RepID=A0AB39UGB2_9BIFI
MAISTAYTTTESTVIATPCEIPTTNRATAHIGAMNIANGSLLPHRVRTESERMPNRGWMVSAQTLSMPMISPTTMVGRARSLSFRGTYALYIAQAAEMANMPNPMAKTLPKSRPRTDCLPDGSAEVPDLSPRVPASTEFSAVMPQWCFGHEDKAHICRDVSVNSR